jgi:FkbM family methyltransferase
MISAARRVARCIRHLPGLENLDGLWNAVRGPYQRLLNTGGGIEIVVPGGVKIRIPAEFAGFDWEHYEPESLRLVADWARRHDDGLFLDIGSATGIFSAVMLFANPRIEVIAFDSDLASIAQTRQFCRYAKGRLQLVHGFVAEAGSQISLDRAVAATTAELLRLNPTGDIGTTRYICLEDPTFADIRRNALDDLFTGDVSNRRPILIKCDVEGAELRVLHGAQKLLEQHQPDLLLSVHPPALPQHGHSRAEIAEFLRRMQYSISVVAIDHEEHWWCQTGTA